MYGDKLTTDEVIERCATLGIQLDHGPFAEHLTELCNRPAQLPPMPLYITSYKDSCWAYEIFKLRYGVNGK